MLIIRKKKNYKLSFHVIIQILQSNFHLTIDYPPITTRAYPYFSAHPIRLSPRKFDFHSRSQLLKWTKVISPSRFDKNLCLCKEKMRSGRRGWRKKNRAKARDDVTFASTALIDCKHFASTPPF